MSRVTIETPFLYIASKPDGGKRVGMVRGRDQRHASEQLRRQRLLPLKTWSVPTWAAGDSARMASLPDQSEIHTQLSQLIGRGVPLVEALDTLVTSVSPSTRPKIARIREMVASGTGFADACSGQNLFDDVTIATLKASERTGDLAGAAKQLSVAARRNLHIRNKAQTLMYYPLIVMSMSSILIVFLLVFLVPKVGTLLAEQYASQGKTLPIFTRALMWVGLSVRDHWLIWSLVLLGVVMLFVVFRAAISTVLLLLARRLPVLKDVVMASESARFFTVMSAMTRSGIPLAECLGVATNAISHPELKSQLTHVRARLIEGGVLRGLIDTVTALPVGTRRLMIAAERSGDLEAAFEAIAGDATEELDRRAMRFLAVLEPALIVFMALAVGGALMAIMIPMFSLVSDVM